MSEFSSALNIALIKKEAKKKDLADYCNVSPTTISRWCNGLAQPNKAHKEQVLNYVEMKESDFYRLGE